MFAQAPSSSKEEALEAATSDFQRRHLEWHLEEDERVFYVGEKRQRIFFFSMITYSCLSLLFALFALLSFVLVETHPHPLDDSSEGDIFDDMTLVWSFSLGAAAILLGVGIASMVHPNKVLCILTRTRLLVVERLFVFPDHVRCFEIEAIGQLSIEYDVFVPKDWDAMEFVDKDIRDSVDGRLKVASRNDGRGPISHLKVSISECRRLVDAFSTLLDQTPSHTVTSQAKQHGFVIALMVGIALLSFVVVAILSSQLRVLPMLFVLCPFYILISSCICFHSFLIIRWLRGIHLLVLDFLVV